MFRRLIITLVFAVASGFAQYGPQPAQVQPNFTTAVAPAAGTPGASLTYWSPTPNSPNLSAWYDISDLSSLRNNAGAVPSTTDGIKLIADKSGNSATNVLCLNGVNGNNAVATAATAFGATDFSVSVKCTPASLAATMNMIQGGTNSFAFFINITTGTLQTSQPGVANNTASTGTVSVLTQYVLTYVRSGTTGTYYINAASAGTTADARNYSVASRYCGSSDAATAVFNGNMTWVRHYSAALSPAEVTADAAGTVQSNCTLDIEFTAASKLAASFASSTGGGASSTTVTINSTGDTGARISGARDLYQGTAANQPIYLPWSGTNYGYLNGVSGNYYSTPDSAAVSITGDIDIQVLMSAADWTPGSIPCILSKYAAAGTRSYLLQLDTTGVLTFTVSVDGTNVVNANSTVAPTVSDGASLWVRATRQASSGNVKFYTGGSASSPTWVQLGTTVSTAASAIFDSAAVLTIGMRGDGTTGPLNGTVRRALIYSGYDGAGTLAFDFNPATYTSGTTFLDSSANAATITLNGGATIVTRTCLYFDGVNDYMKAAAFSLSQPETVYFVGSQVTWTQFDRVYGGGATARTIDLQQNATTPEIELDAGTNGPRTGALALNTNGIITGVFNGASSSIRLNRSTAVTGNPNTGSTGANGFVLGAQASGANNGNITASEVLIYAAAHDTAAQNRVVGFLGAKWGIVT